MIEYKKAGLVKPDELILVHTKTITSVITTNDYKTCYNTIINIVCTFAGITRATLLSSTRANRVPFYRNVAIHLCKMYVLAPDTVELAKLFNVSSSTKSLTSLALYKVQQDPSQQALYQEFITILKIVHHEFYG